MNSSSNNGCWDGSSNRISSKTKRAQEIAEFRHPYFKRGRSDLYHLIVRGSAPPTRANFINTEYNSPTEQKKQTSTLDDDQPKKIIYHSYSVEATPSTLQSPALDIISENYFTQSHMSKVASSIQQQQQQQQRQQQPTILSQLESALFSNPSSSSGESKPTLHFPPNYTSSQMNSWSTGTSSRNEFMPFKNTLHSENIHNGHNNNNNNNIISNNHHHPHNNNNNIYQHAAATPIVFSACDIFEPRNRSASTQNSTSQIVINDNNNNNNSNNSSSIRSSNPTYEQRGTSSSSESKDMRQSVLAGVSFSYDTKNDEICTNPESTNSGHDNNSVVHPNLNELEGSDLFEKFVPHLDQTTQFQPNFYSSHYFNYYHFSNCH